MNPADLRKELIRISRITYDQAVQYISDIPRFTKKNTPGNTKELMRRLGDPEDSFEVIHVAGTNGKGSVCAFLEAMLRRGGKKTGLFTSPHLIRINERFQIDRRMIPDDEFARVFDIVKLAADEMIADGFSHPTYFEMLFAMGMVWFAREKIDILVMETGLGGRLDATNTVRHPKACVITSVSLDHMQYLGNTVELIAAEKAGIIKEGVPVIYDAHDETAARVIRERACRLNAPAVPVYPQMAQIVEYSQDSITYVLNNRFFAYRTVRVPFPAEYQVMNSMVALTALRVLDPLPMICDEKAIEAVQGVKWNGRMETVLPGVVLDGAHNEDGIARFLETVRRIAQKKPVSLLFAAVADKDYEKMIRKICEGPQFTRIVATQVPGSRKVDAQVFAGIFSRYTKAPVYAVSDCREAFDLALRRKEPDGMLFCAGSLYMIGEISAWAADTFYGRKYD